MSAKTFPPHTHKSAAASHPASGSAAAATAHAETNATHNGHGGLEKKKLLAALEAFRLGNFNIRLSEEMPGIDGKIAEVYNQVLDRNRMLARELEKVYRAVGREGKIHQRISLGPVEGVWAENVDSINGLIDDLVWPIKEMSRVIGAVSNGDLSQTVNLEPDGAALRGEFFRTSKTVNTMVNRLSTFAAEVTRVAREVGSEGKLGGQAE